MTTHFKTILALALIVASSIFLSSCFETEDPGPLQEIERTYNITDFDRIEMGDAFQVTVEEGNFFEVNVRGDRRNVDDLIVRTEGSTLVVRYDENENRRHETYVTITMPSLASANLSGASESRISGFYEMDDLDLYLSGASKCQLDVVVTDLHVVLSGASILNLRGEGQGLEAEVSGASSLRAFNFATQVADMNVSGASDVRLTVTDHLSATATGASLVIYRGDPVVSANASGESSIRQE